jgi:hypothetical protein
LSVSIRSRLKPVFVEELHLLVTMLRSFAGVLYGVYATLAFVVVILAMLAPLLISAPWLPVRRSIGGTAVRAWLASVGVRFTIRRARHLPHGLCVVICDRASHILP